MVIQASIAIISFPWLETMIIEHTWTT